MDLFWLAVAVVDLLIVAGLVVATVWIARRLRQVLRLNQAQAALEGRVARLERTLHVGASTPNDGDAST